MSWGTQSLGIAPRSILSLGIIPFVALLTGREVKERQRNGKFKLKNDEKVRKKMPLKKKVYCQIGQSDNPLLE